MPTFAPAVDSVVGGYSPDTRRTDPETSHEARDTSKAKASDMDVPRSAGTAGAETKEINLLSDTETTARVVPIEMIVVENRHRTVFNNIRALADSIVDVGLLSPVLVTSDMRLLDGQRRIEAHKLLGLAEVEVRVAETIIDARDQLVAERDSNTQREPMLLSELTSLGMAIQDMEAPAAKERQGTRNDIVFPGTQSVEADEWGHKTRDIAAEAVGISSTTFTRMKTLLTTAADEAAPEEIREAAKEAVTEIDGGASVRSGYDRVKAMKDAVQPKAVTVDAPAPKRANDPTEYLRAIATLHPTSRIAFDRDGHNRYASHNTLDAAAREFGVKWRFTEKQWQAHVATSSDVLDRATLAIETALSAIAERVDMKTINPKQASEALERLVSTSALSRIIKTLTEITNV